MHCAKLTAVTSTLDDKPSSAFAGSFGLQFHQEEGAAMLQKVAGCALLQFLFLLLHGLHTTVHDTDMVKATVKMLAAQPNQPSTPKQAEAALMDEYSHSDIERKVDDCTCADLDLKHTHDFKVQIGKQAPAH